MQNNRIVAKITGYALLLMAVIAGFSFGFAFPKMYKPSQPDVAQSDLIGNLPVYQFMLLGILCVILLDVLVSWTLYVYFKQDNQRLALLSCILRLAYTVIFSVAAYYLANNLGQVNGSAPAVMANYDSFQTIWSIGLIVFGFHLMLVGVLMKQHKLVPNFLWMLTIVAGSSYIVVHLIKTTSPELTALSSTLNNILGLPMALGELGLAIWLVVKGGKTS